MTPLALAAASLAAREALEAAEAARAHALADAATARTAFEERPTTKTHAAVAVAEQLALNTLAPIEAARAEVERVARAGLEERLVDARTRARHDALLVATAPARARLAELFAEVSSIVGEIESATTAQHRACRDAEAIARELGVHSGSPRPMALTFLRACVGVVIAEAVYRAGARFAIGHEPHTWISPRAEPPSGHPAQVEWRRAKALALPDAYLPPPTCDFDVSAAEVHFFHPQSPNGRPARHEVS